MTGKKKGTTGMREDGGSDRRKVKHRYIGDRQNEEEGNPSSRRSSWMHPVIGWMDMAAFASLLPKLFHSEVVYCMQTGQFTQNRAPEGRARQHTHSWPPWL